MSQLSTTSVLSLFDTDKDGRELFVVSINNAIQSGYVSPLDVYLQLKNIEAIFKGLTDTSDKNKQSGVAKQFKESLLLEAEKNGKKFEFKNAECSIVEAGTKYDFSQCGDPVYFSLVEEMKQLDKKVKERENYLKSITELGEVIFLFPPSKKSTTTFIVELK